MNSDDDIPVIQFFIPIYHLFAIDVISLHTNITVLPITIPNGVKDIRTVHQKFFRFLRYRSTSTEISYL